MTLSFLNYLFDKLGIVVYLLHIVCPYRLPNNGIEYNYNSHFIDQGSVNDQLVSQICPAEVSLLSSVRYYWNRVCPVVCWLSVTVVAETGCPQTYSLLSVPLQKKISEPCNGWENRLWKVIKSTQIPTISESIAQTIKPLPLHCLRAQCSWALFSFVPNQSRSYVA